MQITGKIIAVMPIKTGITKKGTEWKSQEYVIETTRERYPKKMMFSVWNENIPAFALEEGMDVEISFDIDATEWNGKWFNNITCWKATPV